MKLTYIPIINDVDLDSIAGRVIVSTLESQKVNVTVQPIILPKPDRNDWKSLGNASWLRQLWNGLFDDQVDELIESMEEIVLISLNDFRYIYVVDKLLKSGRRVVVGGPVLKIRSFKDVLSYLIDQFGNDMMFLAKNLIAVKGMVDKTTDLKSIIDKWQTVTIKENQWETFYDCDYQWNDNIKNFVFAFKCPWLKCSFCNRRKLPVIDFTENATAQRIYNNLNSLNGKSIRINDDYFMFTGKIKEVLDHSKHQYVEAQTGVPQLANREYIKNCNKYINKMKIGLESMTDYSLRALKKIHSFKNLIEMQEAILEHGDPEKLHIQPYWIVDAPASSGMSVRYNYDRLLNYRQKFIDAGFKFTIYPSFMSLLPTDGLTKTKYYDYRADAKHYAGMSYFGVFPRKPGEKATGLVRLSETGKELKSDMEIIDKDILDILFNDFIDHLYSPAYNDPWTSVENK